jgi:hypothetical protein
LGLPLKLILDKSVTDEKKTVLARAADMTAILSSTAAGTPERMKGHCVAQQNSLYGRINHTHKIMRFCPIWKKLDTESLLYKAVSSRDRKKP